MGYLSQSDHEIVSNAVAEAELTTSGEIVTVLLEEIRTATGTGLHSIINQLSVSGDPRAVPELVNRFQLSGEGEGRVFLQAIAQNGSKAAAILRSMKCCKRRCTFCATSGPATSSTKTSTPGFSGSEPATSLPTAELPHMRPPCSVKSISVSGAL